MMIAQRIVACAALLAALVPAQAWASNWVYVSKTDKAVTYVDTSSISRSGSVVRYWLHLDFVNGPDGWKQATQLWENNCATSQTRLLQLTVYRTDGSIRTSTADQWEYVIPDTSEMVTHELVCAK